MNVRFLRLATAHYQWMQQHKPKLKRKIDDLIDDILLRPYQGLGKPEALKHEYAGWWSRRISDEHRLVYRVDGNDIIILQCRFHYDKR